MNFLNQAIECVCFANELGRDEYFAEKREVAPALASARSVASNRDLSVRT